MVMLAMPISAIEECGRFTMVKDIPCSIISTWKPSGACEDHNLSIYNQTGLNILNLSWGTYFPVCNATFNISEIGTYYYNSSIENGVITVNGEDESMILSITIFLLLINLVLFYLPFKVRFSSSEAGDYIVKRMVWIGAFLLLWFNSTLFRQLSVTWGLGIDSFMEVYWWLFTLGTFICVFLMCYYALVGGTKLMKEAQMRKRMGDDERPY